MNGIQVFQNHHYDRIRAMCDENGEPLFVAKDVCAILDLGNPRSSIALLDDDEKGVHSVDTPGGKQQMTTVTEPGFYKLVMRSRKPEAKAFQRWVTHEVLPALRRDGAVVLSDGTEDEDTLIARALLAVKRKLDERDRQLGAAEAENRRLTAVNAGLRAKASLYDDWVDDTDGLISVTRAGKLLKSVDPTMGAKRLRGLLRRDGYIEQRTLSATVKAIEPGYMRERMVKIPTADGGTRAKSYECLTAKGVGMCAARYCNKAERVS